MAIQRQPPHAVRRECGAAEARGGAEPLLATLRALFDAAGNAAAADPPHRLSVRTALYRIDRLEQLTGLRMDDPHARLDTSAGLPP